MKKYLIVLISFIIPMQLFSQVQSDVPNLQKKDRSNLEYGKTDSMQQAELYYSACHDSLRAKDAIIAHLMEENKALTAKVERADALAIRIMNNRLISKFNKKNVVEAIADYHNISNQKLKEEYSYRESLLKLYEGYYLEIKLFVEQLQQDKTRINKFNLEEYKKKYTQAMKGLGYYSYYVGDDKKKKIPYLDHILSLIEIELSKHGKADPVTDKKYFSNFSSILEELAD